MSRGISAGKSLLPGLQRDLEARLSALEREAAAIRGALKALAIGAERSAPSRRDAREDLISALGEQPGSRTSLLALGQGRPVDAVAATLEILAREGVVVRDGLGWRLLSE